MPTSTPPIVPSARISKFLSGVSWILVPTHVLLFQKRNPSSKVRILSYLTCECITPELLSWFFLPFTISIDSLSLVTQPNNIKQLAHIKIIIWQNYNLCNIYINIQWQNITYKLSLPPYHSCFIYPELFVPKSLIVILLLDTKIPKSVLQSYCCQYVIKDLSPGHSESATTYLRSASYVMTAWVYSSLYLLLL